MGHSIAEEFVPVDNFDTSKMNNRNIIDAAVHQWREMEASPYDSENAGMGVRAPGMTRDVAERYTSLDSQFPTMAGPSLIIPIVDEYVESKKKVKTNLHQEQVASLSTPGGYGRQCALREIANGVATSSGVSDHEIASVRVTKEPRQTKPVAKAAGGVATTVYSVVAGTGFAARDTGSQYDTQAEARAAAIEYMEDHPDVVQASVRAQVVRESGDDDLVVVTRPAPKSASIEVEVTIQTPKTNAEPVGWLVAFDYHH